MSPEIARMLSERRVLVFGAFLAGVIATPTVALVAGFVGWIPADAASTPPRWELRLGQIALDASLARQADGLVTPLKGSNADLIAGMNTYRNDCAGCHGDYGQHRSGGGLYPPVPQFAQHPPLLTVSQMFVAAKYGVRYSGMGGWSGEISDYDIWRTVVFLSRLDSLPPTVVRLWKAKRQ